MRNGKQFRIKYYDFDDSQLYTIIQVAPTLHGAIKNALERISKNTNNFSIIEVEELGIELLINETRRRLINSISREREKERMAKKKKNTIKTTFEIKYTRGDPRQIFITNITDAIDKDDAILKFKERYPGTRIKEINERTIQKEHQVR